MRVHVQLLGVTQYIPNIWEENKFEISLHKGYGFKRKEFKEIKRLRLLSSMQH